MASEATVRAKSQYVSDWRWLDPFEHVRDGEKDRARENVSQRDG